MSPARETALLPTRQRRLRRRTRAMLRDTWVLVREFWWILALFALTIVLSAISFQWLWNRSPLTPIRLIDAFYYVGTMLFFQPTLDFPREWYLDVYFFLMPLLGLIFLALGVADFAVLLVNRRLRQNKWEESVASTYSEHIIVAGLGHLGIRVVRELVRLDEDVVVIEMKTDNERIDEVRSHKIPVLIGDARSVDVLKKAGLDRALSVIVCTNNDLVNLQIGARIREIDKDVPLVMRLFNEEFAGSIAEPLNISAVMSASLLAAPAFAGAATRTNILQTFRVEDRVLAMGRIEVSPNSRLEGCTIATIGEELDVSVVLLQTDGQVDVHPEPDATLSAGNVIAVVAELPALKALTNQWNRARTR
jgi:voltage-gated potassium channel